MLRKIITFILSLILIFVLGYKLFLSKFSNENIIDSYIQEVKVIEIGNSNINIDKRNESKTTTNAIVNKKVESESIVKNNNNAKEVIDKNNNNVEKKEEIIKKEDEIKEEKTPQDIEVTEIIKNDEITSNKNIWEELGMTEYQYYNEPVNSYEKINFSVKDYGTRENAKNACLEYGDNYEPYLNGEEAYHCSTVYSASGKYLGEWFHTEKTLQ